MMKVALLVVSQLGLLVSAAAPAPRVPEDCDHTIILMNLATCLDYVVLYSNTTTPSKECCDGLAAIVKDTPICLCHFLNNGTTSRLPISITRFVGLPGACKINTPPPTDCKKRKGPPPSSTSDPEFHDVVHLIYHTRSLWEKLICADHDFHNRLQTSYSCCFNFRIVGRDNPCRRRRCTLRRSCNLKYSVWNKCVE